MKLGLSELMRTLEKVAPHAGARIETISKSNRAAGSSCRPPRGGAD